MRHVIWDWNGTLVDDFPVIVDSVNTSLALLGSSPITGDQYRTHYTRPVRVFYKRLLGREVSDAEWQQINTTFHDAYESSLDKVPLTVDARDAVAAVAAAGATQSVLSMWTHEELVPEVVRKGLDTAMVRVDGNPHTAGDTKSRLLEIHLANLNHSAPAVLIGDAVDDAAAAKEVGIPCVLYDGGSHHRDQMDAVGVPVAESLTAAVSIALNVQ
ncbi:MAG: HAD hydrolase-like protein [Acidimicrobiia bacterium]|nr:HAD hydrolase-like protein [Acidimicrobiia bacterium]